MKRRAGALPAATALLGILFLGYAFIRLGSGRRVAEKRAAAAQLAAASADSVGRQLENALVTLSDTVAEISQRGTVDLETVAEAKADRATLVGSLFVVSGRQIRHLDAFQPGVGNLERATADWDLGPHLAEAHWERRPVLLPPLRAVNGEWIIFARLPLLLADQAGSKHFAGWLGMSTKLDELLRSTDLGRLPASGYDYELSYVNTNSMRPLVLSRSTEFTLKAPITQVIHGTRSQWILCLAPKDGWSPWSPILVQGILVGAFALIGAVTTHDATHKSNRLHRELEKHHQRLRLINHRLMEQIQQREELEQQFSHASFHDALTGLPNRRYFINHLERALRRARTTPGPLVAVIVLNLDRFKNINESLGYTAGDELLTQAVQRLEDCLRPSDLIMARVGGDEFAILLFDISGADVAGAAAQRLQDALARPFDLNGQSVFTTASIGIALSSSGYEHADELVRRADMALSKAKTEGRARYAVYDPATRDQIVTLQRLETDLHQALERREFCLNFQPIVSLETGRIAGMEALVRWSHPLEGAVMPGRFIRVAEETGLIVSINRWVMREACLQARAWRDQFPDDIDFYLSANLSGRDLQRSDLCDFVAGVLKETGLPAGVLRLEVTESVMIGNVKAASELVTRFREMGVPLLLDDFGTGYSSLSYLHRFKFDFIKIDRAFVSRITPGGENASIVRAIVHLAGDLGMKTIAEGIETAEDVEVLRELGCEYAQGYYFSKPVEPGLAENLLLSRRRW